MFIHRYILYTVISKSKLEKYKMFIIESDIFLSLVILNSRKNSKKYENVRVLGDNKRDQGAYIYLIPSSILSTTCLPTSSPGKYQNQSQNSLALKIWHFILHLFGQVSSGMAAKGSGKALENPPQDRKLQKYE